jgi:hypothetical protein
MAVGPFARHRARQIASRGAQLLSRDHDAAADRCREALEVDPECDIAWFNLALIHKWRAEWEPAFDCNLRAAELLGERREEPAWWNLGIAATALHRWDVARRAWRAYGLDLPDGEGPIEAHFGFGPVRLNPDGEAEVVWGHRIDPARVRVASIPFPRSGHRWADVVLHDGEPKGYRERDGQRWPVFDELVRWEPSDVPTVQVAVGADAAGDVDDLIDRIERAGHAAEDWTTNTRMLCAECSRGVAHQEHSDAALASGREHLLGVAGPIAEVTALVDAWAEAPGRHRHSVE